MPRPKKAIRSVCVRIYLPEDLVAEIETFLFSAAEGRVPYNAWRGLIEPFLRERLQGIKHHEKNRIAAGLEG